MTGYMPNPVRAESPPPGCELVFVSAGVLDVAPPATGEQVFIKTMRDDAANARDYRIETIVAAALPETVPTPRLRFAPERAEWLLLCFGLAPGALPHEPWRPGKPFAALQAPAVCARELTPSPVDGLPTLAKQRAGRCETCRHWSGTACGTRSPPSLGEGERDHLPRLASVEMTTCPGSLP
ncbi:hypothetical protein AB0J63_34345 [Streptosporangium canum]|uniref:hypothetical protein n=1 Tax=Streptosporangium canum TaxID=324952 RepID=UPI003420019C